MSQSGTSAPADEAAALAEPAQRGRGATPAEREFIRGLELHRAEQLDQALKHHARAAALDPGHAMAWNNMGVLLRKQGKRKPALACYRRAVALAEADASNHSNLGNVLRDLGRLEEAELHGARAVALAPDNAGTHHNHGLILQDLGRHAEAVAEFDIAIRIDPRNAGYRWDRALNLLMAGDLARGFAEYEVRWKLPHNPAPTIAPAEWTGESLEGKTILLWSEQGFGDTLQFIRYAPMVKARGATKVLLLAQPPLARLLSGAPGVDQVVTEGAQDRNSIATLRSWACPGSSARRSRRSRPNAPISRFPPRPRACPARLARGSWSASAGPASRPIRTITTAAPGSSRSSR